MKVSYRSSHIEAPIYKLPYIYIYKYISLGPFQKLDLVEAPKTIVSNTTSVVKKLNFCLSKGGGFGTPRAFEDLLIHIAIALLSGKRRQE